MKWRVKPNTRHFTFAKWWVLGFTQHFTFAKWRVLGFTQHFTFLHAFIWQLFWSNSHGCTFQQCISCEIGNLSMMFYLSSHSCYKSLKSLVFDSWLQMTCCIHDLTSKTSYWDCLLTGYLHYCGAHHEVQKSRKCPQHHPHD